MYVCLSVWKHILSIHSLCLESTRILDEFKLLQKYEHILVQINITYTEDEHC